jgi:plasminogen activator
MIRTPLIMRSGGLLAATLLLSCWSQVAMAAGPVAVAPGQSATLVETPTDRPVSFSVKGGLGYLTGESTEVVYWPDRGNHKASELTWAIDDLFMVGVGANLKIRDFMAVNFTGWFAATDGEGSMDDYDYLNVGGDWTDWSRHENTDVTEGSIIDLSVEFNVIRADSFQLKLIGGYKRDDFGWEAIGGEYTYSENGGFRNETGTFADGLAVIGYEQTFTTLYGGIGIGIQAPMFELSGRLIYSPIAQGEATDNHYLRNLVTYDEGEDGDMLAFDVAGTFVLSPNFAIEVAYSYQKYDMMQGDSEWYYRDEGVVILLEDGAGMDQTSSLFSVALRYTF